MAIFKLADIATELVDHRFQVFYDTVHKVLVIIVLCALGILALLGLIIAFLLVYVIWCLLAESLIVNIDMCNWCVLSARTVFTLYKYLWKCVFVSGTGGV
jgi:hypothetical protein